MKTSHHPSAQIIQNASTVSLLILGLFGFSLLAHHKSVSTGGFIFNWSSRYLLFVLLPLFCFWFTQFLFLTHERFRNLFLFRNKIYQRCLNLSIIFFVFLSMILKVNVYQAKVLFFILSVLAMLAVFSFQFKIKNLMLTYFCLSVLGCLLFTFELPQLLEPRHNKRLIHWEDRGIFEFLFEKKPPFIGLGGRLRPSVRCRISSSADPLGVRFATNQWGFRNDEAFGESPEQNETRILSMGDSYSTGYGNEQDRFLGPFLERGLQKTFPNRKILVMNAEVSDPAYGLYYFQNCAERFSPKIVVYGISRNDILQNYWFISYFKVFKFKGNQLVPGIGTQNNIPVLDKAGPNFWDKTKDITYPVPGTFTDGPLQKMNNPFQPFLEDLIKFRAVIYLKQTFFPFKAEDDSRLFRGKIPEIVAMEGIDGKKRLIDGATTNLGLFYKKRIPLIEEMYRVFFKSLHVMALKAKQNGQLFVLIYFPERIQVQQKDWELLRSRWNLSPDDFNLDLYNQRMAKYCKTRRINFLDLTTAFRNGSRDKNLYLPNDGHPNRLGHAIAAQALSDFLTKKMKVVFQPVKKI